MARVYAGNNVEKLVENIREVSRVHSAQRPFAIASFISDYMSQNDGFDDDSLMKFLRLIMGFNLEYGYFARNKYTLREILSGKLKNRMMLQRMQVLYDENDGLFRSAVTQIARKNGYYFFYSVDLVVSDSEVELRALQSSIEARAFSQEQQQGSLGPNLAANLRTSFASLRSQVLEFVDADEAAMLLVEESGRIAFANSKARRMFSPLAGNEKTDAEGEGKSDEAKPEADKEPSKSSNNNVDSNSMAKLVGMSIHKLTPTYVRGHHSEKVASFFANPSPALLGTGRPLSAARVDDSEFRVAINLDLLDTGAELLAVARLFDMSEVAAATDEFNERMEESKARAAQAEGECLAQFVNSVSAPVIVVNVRSEIVECNADACELLKCDRSFILDNPIHTFVPAYIRAAHELLVRHFFFNATVVELGGANNERLFPAQAQDGSEVGVNITLRKLQYRDQWLAVALLTVPCAEMAEQVSDFASRFDDLVTITRAREAAAKAEERPLLQAFLDAGEEAALAVSELGGIAAVNSISEKMFGYGEGELLKRPVDVITPAHVAYNHYDKVRSFFVNSANRALGGTGRQLNGRRKDGEEFPVQITLGMYLLSEGNIAVARVREHTAYLESTARANAIMEKQLEARATLEDSLLMEFLAKCGADNDAALVVKNDGEMLLCNDATCRLFGYDREELIGQSIDMLTPRSIRSVHKRKVAFYFLDPSPRMMSGTNAGLLNLKAAHKSKDEFPVQIALNHLNTRHGTVATCIVRDMSRVKHLTEEVAKAKEEEEVRRRKRVEIIETVIRNNPWIRAVSDT